MENIVIEAAFGFIYKGIQQVGIKFENSEKAIFLNPPDVKKAVGLDIHEVELLAGSQIKPVFYQKGDTMKNGKECYRDEYFIKDFELIPKGTIEQMKKINSRKLDPYKKVLEVYSFHRRGKKFTGFVVGTDKTVYVSTNIVKAFTRLEPEDFKILEGSYVYPKYYKVGEDINDDLDLPPEPCRKPNTILKQFNIRMVDTAKKMQENFDNYRLANNFNHSSYKKYGGPHGFDDMAIDVAFEGDPANIWNIL
jgi:hypothetical protein